MQYLYGLKRDTPRRLIATFDSEQQLLSYVRWATLQSGTSIQKKFEQGSPLVGYHDHEYSNEPLTDEDPHSVPHNPTPSML